MNAVTTSLILPPDLAERVERRYAAERLTTPEVKKSAILRRALRAGFDALDHAQPVNPGSNFR